MIKPFFIFYFIIFFNKSGLISGEYNVGHEVPSYLYRMFDNVKEDIFPSEIRINMSLRRIDGTLLYSIDRHKNQLIVKLIKSYDPNINLEFRTKKFFFHLSQICKCIKHTCEHDILDLIIRIEDDISIQCNNGSLEKYTFDNTIALNEDYPLMNSNYINKSLLNEAHLWLVNTQDIEGKYSNPDQLSGCIFNVWYKNKTFNFTNISPNINQTCSRLCSNNPCNGGECIETYNDEPHCDCTKAFGNGKYCNETLSSINGKLIKENLQFSKFKLSWNSTSKKILNLSNSNVNFRVYCNGSELTLDYVLSDGYFIKSILWKPYEKKKNYIIIASFDEEFIYIHFFNNTHWSQLKIWSSRDLRKENFTSLELRSRNGTIGFVYEENSNPPTWKNLSLNNLKEIAKDCDNDLCNGGECIETDDEEHLCNCTKAFGNGEKCENNFSNITLKQTNQTYKFPTFKMSWNSSSDEILVISNSVVQIRIYFTGSMLDLEYNREPFQIKRTLSKTYKEKKEYIFIATFNGDFMDIQFFNNTHWNQLKIWSYLNLSQETFTSLTLESGDGKLGFLYKKYVKNVKWKEIKNNNTEKNKVTKTQIVIRYKFAIIIGALVVGRHNL